MANKKIEKIIYFLSIFKIAKSIEEYTTIQQEQDPNRMSKIPSYRIGKTLQIEPITGSIILLCLTFSFDFIYYLSVLSALARTQTRHIIVYFCITFDGIIIVLLLLLLILLQATRLVIFFVIVVHLFSVC